jgi:hypothetical protein
MSDLLWRYVPITLLVIFITFALAREIVTPHPRMIKLFVAMVLLMMMLRFQMIYSLYIFFLLYTFPSAISIGSTNQVFATLILLIWFVRAHSEKIKLFTGTKIDKFVVVFIGAYIVSLFNVEQFSTITKSLMFIWTYVTAIVIFYLIVRLVDDERKLLKLAQVLAIGATLVFVTGLIEMFFPGTTIIPGWIELKGLNMSTLSRYRGIGGRVGGAIGEGILSDFAATMILLIVYFFIRSKNPLPKVLWGSFALLAFFNLIATANRGAFFSLSLAILYFFYLYRKKISLIRIVSITVLFIGVLALGEFFLAKYTYVALMTGRITGTEFEGGVPDTRVGVWGPALIKSLDHIIIGHGPVYLHGVGDTPDFWPHNAYIYYLYTVGVVGLFAFLAIVYKLMKMTLSFKKKVVWGTPLGSLMSIFHLQICIFLILQLRTDHQRDDMYPYMVWILFGLITAAANVIRKKEDEKLETNRKKSFVEVRE